MEGRLEQSESLEIVDLVDLIREVLQVARYACGYDSANVSLTCHIQPDLSRCIYTGFQAVHTALLNLVSNACNHTAVGSIHVDVRQCVDADGDAAIEFRVIDTGHGVPQERQHVVFQPFASFSGNIGLGLYIVQEYSNLLGGACGFLENSGGRGSVFWFRVPYFPLSTHRPVGDVNINGDASADAKVTVVTKGAPGSERVLENMGGVQEQQVNNGSGAWSATKMHGVQSIGKQDNGNGAWETTEMRGMRSRGQDDNPVVASSSAVGIAMGLVAEHDHATEYSDNAARVEEAIVTEENGLGVDTNVSDESIIVVVPANPELGSGCGMSGESDADLGT